MQVGMESGAGQIHRLFTVFMLFLKKCAHTPRGRKTNRDWIISQIDETRTREQSKGVWTIREKKWHFIYVLMPF